MDVNMKSTEQRGVRGDPDVSEDHIAAIFGVEE
jgi:hypothetical protein